MKKWLAVGLVIMILGGCSKSEKVADSDLRSNSRQEETANLAKEKTSKRRKKTKLSTESSTSATLDEKSEKTTESTEEKKAQIEKSMTVFCDPDESQEVGYFNDGQSFGAIVPDFKAYNKEDAFVILGEPSIIVTEKSELVARLDLEGSEMERIKEEFQKEKLTESQAKAFMFQATDIKLVTEMGLEVEGLIYDDPQKPNVYLLDGEVAYVTPVIEYLEFHGRLPLK
ncbi:DUF4947 domain-containing protein [Vagococcus sp. BWB3-3]|uniref:DUF4947 domain-containing protein n=1 Tax=Vagococcus allomyrinae TaxID=2794353 RepID=A0A940SVZ8_9ENTE|nr:DUF4947 domain-containing protein [Vagococcus allomyrinae]MBP1040858.1 DUF4947 domain-containing protein [Vagococcus allomyrinae]